MNKLLFGKRIAAMSLAAAMLLTPIASLAQTQIKAPKNKYKVQDDVKLGTQASVEVEKQFPIITDADAANYISRVGSRLVTAIPPEFQHPEFTYRFKWVNASDINAFRAARRADVCKSRPDASGQERGRTRGSDGTRDQPWSASSRDGAGNETGQCEEHARHARHDYRRCDLRRTNRGAARYARCASVGDKIQPGIRVAG